MSDLASRARLAAIGPAIQLDARAGQLARSSDAELRLALAELLSSPFTMPTHRTEETLKAFEGCGIPRNGSREAVIVAVLTIALALRIATRSVLNACGMPAPSEPNAGTA